MEKAAKKIHEKINEVVKKIKFNENIHSKDMEKYYQSLVDQINKELSNVKSKVLKVLNFHSPMMCFYQIEKQKVAEEQEKLRRLQQEMEEQKRKKEAEEAEARRLEEERRIRAEMEVRRKTEEEKRKREEEKEKKKVASMQEDLDRANARLAEQREQARLF